jgi:hypothetical protein
MPSTGRMSWGWARREATRHCAHLTATAATEACSVRMLGQ